MLLQGSNTKLFIAFFLIQIFHQLVSHGQLDKMANSNPRLGCSEDSECGNGKQCVDNICITKYSRRVVCDPPCNPPYTCIQGKFQKHCVLRPKSIKSQGVSMMKNDKDHTIEVTLDLNQDGIKLHSSGENGPEHPKIRRRELGPEEPLLDSVEGEDTSRKIYCCNGKDPEGERTLTCLSMCDCLAFHSVQIFKPNNTEMVACNTPSFDVPNCLKKQCVGRKGKGRSLADIGRLIGVADKLLEPGTLDKISKILGQSAGILAQLNSPGNELAHQNSESNPVDQLLDQTTKADDIANTATGRQLGGHHSTLRGSNGFERKLLENNRGNFEETNRLLKGICKGVHHPLEWKTMCV